MNDVAASSDSTFQLASWSFVALAGLFVVGLRVLRRGWPRQLLIAGLNLAFLAALAIDTGAWCVLGGVILGTFALSRLKATDWGDRLPGGVWAGAIVLMWLFLFLVKQPNLLPAVNPFHRFPIAVVGISYIIFRCIAWVLDTLPGDRPSLLSLINYVTFLPTLLAGPIETYERFREFEQGDDLELNESPLPSLHRIANGFLKKYLFAELVGAFSITGDATLSGWGTPAIVVGILVLPLVLYLDFSGYCDIMIGLVRLAGFRLAENFDRPWLATNIQEFWNRWHMTLSEFIRNYTFNPLWKPLVTWLPADRHFATAMGLYFFTMVLMGLWHAPTAGFLAFGILHGAALVAVQVWHRWQDRHWQKPTREAWRRSRLASLGGAALTYLVVAASMVFWTQGVTRTWELLLAVGGASHG